MLLWGVMEGGVWGCLCEEEGPGVYVSDCCISG